jgi:hypothetical protein
MIHRRGRSKSPATSTPTLITDVEQFCTIWPLGSGVEAGLCSRVALVALEQVLQELRPFYFFEGILIFFNDQPM